MDTEITSKSGKFKNISIDSILNILQFITTRENHCILFELNKFFMTLMLRNVRKDNSLNICLKEISGIIKQTEEFKLITKDHCQNLDDNLTKFRNNYSPFVYNRAVYLISSYIFKDSHNLDLQRNNVGLDGVILLHPLLKRSNLLHLNLSCNNISDEGCKFLSNSVKKNNSLSVLNLECNGISDKGIISMGEAFVVNKSLKTVKMALNVVTLEGLKHLADLFEKSPTQINVFDFKYNNIVVRDDSQVDYFRKHKITF